MRFRILLSFVTLFLVLPSYAQKNAIAVFANGASYRSTSVEVYSPGLPILYPGTATASFESRTGYGLCLDRQLSPHVTAELALQRLKIDAIFGTKGPGFFDGHGSIGTLSLTDVDAALQWHFAPRSTYDVYVGAGAARIQGSALDKTNRADVEPQRGPARLDDKLTWLGEAGVNLQLTSKASVLLQAKYLRYRSRYGQLEIAAIKQVRLDPVTVALGLRWRV